MTTIRPESNFKPIGYGYSKFTYTREDVDYLKASLTRNGRSISKVFRLVRTEPEFRDCDPVQVVDLIEQVWEGKIHFSP